MKKLIFSLMALLLISSLAPPPAKGAGAAASTAQPADVISYTVTPGETLTLLITGQAKSKKKSKVTGHAGGEVTSFSVVPGDSLKFRITAASKKGKSKAVGDFITYSVMPGDSLTLKITGLQKKPKSASGAVLAGLETVKPGVDVVSYSMGPSGTLQFRIVGEKKSARKAKEKPEAEVVKVEPAEKEAAPPPPVKEEKKEEKEEPSEVVKTPGEGLALGYVQYHAGAGDVLFVEVYDEKDLTGEFKVGENGAIDFPLLGKVPVSGKTTGEIKDTLREALGRDYLVNPQVQVTIKDYRVQGKIYVAGAVKVPGAYPYEGGLTVLNAVVLSGGFTETANPGKSKLTHQKDGKTETIPVNLKKILKGKEKDIPLEPGDRLFVPESLF